MGDIDCYDVIFFIWGIWFGMIRVVLVVLRIFCIEICGVVLSRVVWFFVNEIIVSFVIMRFIGCVEVSGNE